MVWSQKKAAEFEEAFKKAMTLWEQRDAEKALAQFRKAAQVDDRDPELWVMIGRCELVSGHLDRAPAAWEEALKRHPGYRPALFERAKEALGRGIAKRVPPPVDAAGWLPQRLDADGGSDETKRVLADLREASQHGPAFLNFARGAIHLVDGRYKEALPGFQEYADQNAWDATAFAMPGIAALYAALPDRAERALSEALSRRKENAWHKARADARYLQGKYAVAKEDYRDAGLEKEAEPLFARRLPSQALILWLRADAGVEVSGSSVTRWEDQSGAKNHAAPRDPAVAAPQLSAAAVRGRPAIAFKGKEDELWLPDGFETFGAGLSAFVVGEPSTEPGDEWSFLFLATPARGAARIEAFIGKRRESDQVVYSSEDLEKQNYPFIAGIPPAKEFESFGAIHEPSGTARLYKRGSPVVEKPLILPRKILRTRNRVGAGLKGRVAEVVLYNRSLTEIERLGVEAYLKDRYFPDAAPAEKR
jgi:tetratricopeptide (TPR) repeat protein